MPGILDMRVRRPAERLPAEQDARAQQTMDQREAILNQLATGAPNTFPEGVPEKMYHGMRPSTIYDTPLTDDQKMLLQWEMMQHPEALPPAILTPYSTEHYDMLQPAQEDQLQDPSFLHELRRDSQRGQSRGMDWMDLAALMSRSSSA